MSCCITKTGSYRIVKSCDKCIGTGAQGSQGPIGPQGPLGGPPGPQGSQGPQGTQGNQGAQGPQGTQGVQGQQGSQGVQGAQSAQGAQGPQGAAGTGAQGPQGSQGSQGAQGSQGSQGTQGAQGPQGLQGPLGPQGASQGLQGVQGSQGPQGTQGSQGPQGTLGSQGPQGTGLVGPTGATGATGSESAASSIYGTYINNVVQILTIFTNDNVNFFSSLGSGYVLDAMYHIVTNSHVVNIRDNTVTEIWVTFFTDNKTYRATVIGYDNHHDVAVIKVVDGKTPLLPIVFPAWRNSRLVSIGEGCLALGHPSGSFVQSIAKGTVIDNKCHDPTSASSSIGIVESILSDFETTNGNSGGPIFDLSGNVIGILEFTSPSANNYVINGGVCSFNAQRIVEYIINTTTASPFLIPLKFPSKYLGVSYSAFSSFQQRSFYGFTDPDMFTFDVYGYIVKTVLPGSPASAATPSPIQVNDVILEFNGVKVGQNNSFVPLSTFIHFQNYDGSSTDTVQLEILRYATQLPETVTVTLTSIPVSEDYPLTTTQENKVSIEL